MTFVLPSLKYPIITITFFFVLFRMFRPMRASDGSKSNTLTGLFAATMIIFMIVVIDSINDRPEAPQETVSSASTGTRKRAESALQSAKSRNVIKEKYGILLMVWVGFSILYLLSHRSKDIQLMGIRFLMAVRGQHNPLPDDDPVDRYLVSCLESDTSDRTREWAIEVMLARKGITPSWKNGTATQPLLVSPEGKDAPPPPPAIPDFLKND